MREMEALLEAKEQEIIKLEKMKDVLKQKFKIIQAENSSLKAKLKDFDSSEKSEKKSTDHNLTEEKIDNLKKEVEHLAKENTKLQEELDKQKKSDNQSQSQEYENQLKEKDALIKDQSDKIKILETELISSKSVENKEKVDKSIDTIPIEEDNIKLILKQLKNGLFKLGQQNFSIEKKIDRLMTTANLNSSMNPSLKPSITHEPSSKAKIDTKENEKDISNKKGLKSPTVLVGSSDPAKNPHLAPKEHSKENLSESGSIIDGILTIPRQSNSYSIVCPHCGAQNFVEQDDRKRIISYVPVPKYGKKYYCRECRGEWRYSN